MPYHPLRLAVIAALLAPLALGACGPDDQTAAPAPERQLESPPAATPPAAAPFRVTSIEVGSAVSEDKRISSPRSTFAPDDTIYVSVASDGAAERVELTARWTDEGGHVLNETTQAIAPTGPAASEFHISQPSGLSPGRYQVEILADGRSVGTQQFEVQEESRATP